MSKQEAIKEILQSQANMACYNGLDCTRMHRICMYDAFLSMLESRPREMTDYLMNGQRGYNLQHKIFQSYISILESKIPFIFTKNNQFHYITSLLDHQLGLFDGISVFDGHINNKHYIKNETTEFYVGGRKAYYINRYYIGKLLDVVNMSNGLSMMDQVREYSFNKIYMYDETPLTQVRISHLRIPPHYQMGGMVYLNRIRKEIVKALTARASYFEAA